MELKKLAWRTLGGLALSLAGTAAFASAVPPGLSTPGIVDPGYVSFWDTGETVKVTRFGTSAANHYWKVEATGSNSKFNYPTNSWNLTSESTRVTAYFKEVGTGAQLITSKPGCSGGGCTLTNEVEIKGKLPAGSYNVAPYTGKSWGAVTSLTTLFKAKITDFGVDLSTTPSPTDVDKGLGFKTTNFSGWANQPQFTTGSTSESVWLFDCGCTLDPLLKALDGTASTSGFKLSTTIGSSKTYNGIESITTVPIPAAVWLFGSALAGIGAATRRRQAAMAVA